MKLLTAISSGKIYMSYRNPYKGFNCQITVLNSDSSKINCV